MSKLDFGYGIRGAWTTLHRCTKTSKSHVFIFEHPPVNISLQSVIFSLSNPSKPPSQSSPSSDAMPRNSFLLLLLPLAFASHIPHVPRQTTPAEASACLAAVMAVGSTFPTVPPELVGITDVSPITNPCDYTPPAAVATAFSSFESVLLSWVSENWPKVTSALEKCPAISSEVAGFAKAWEGVVCTNKIQTLSTGTGTGSGVKPTGTPTTTKSGDESLTRIETQTQATTTGSGSGPGPGEVRNTSKSAGGASETGFVAGIVAAAGFVGAVMAL